MVSSGVTRRVQTGWDAEKQEPIYSDLPPWAATVAIAEAESRRQAARRADADFAFQVSQVTLTQADEDRVAAIMELLNVD